MSVWVELIPSSKSSTVSTGSGLVGSGSVGSGSVGSGSVGSGWAGCGAGSYTSDSVTTLCSVSIGAMTSCAFGCFVE